MDGNIFDLTMVDSDEESLEVSFKEIFEGFCKGIGEIYGPSYFKEKLV